MNKDIIQRLKDSLDYEFELSFNERKELLSYIEKLEGRVAYLERSNDRREDTIRCLRDELIDVETNRDKAIERIQYEEMFDNDNNHLINFKEELKYILLKGGSDE